MKRLRVKRWVKVMVGLLIAIFVMTSFAKFINWRNERIDAGIIKVVPHNAGDR